MKKTKLYCIAPLPLFLQITASLKIISTLLVIALTVVLIITLVHHLVKKRKIFDRECWNSFILILAFLAFSSVPLNESVYLFSYSVFFLVLLLGQIFGRLLKISEPKRWVTFVFLILVLISIAAGIVKINTVTNETNLDSVTNEAMLGGCGNGSDWW